MSCICPLWLVLVFLQNDFEKCKTFLFPWQEQSTGLPTCCSASTSFEVESRRRSRETIKARHQGWKCPSWAAGLVTAHSSHPCPWPPIPPCPTKLLCPSLFTVLEDRSFVLWTVIKLGLLFISTLNYNFLGALGSHTQFPRGLCTLYWKYTRQHNFFSFNQGRCDLLTSVCAVFLSKYHQAIISSIIAHLANPHWYWFFSAKIFLHSKCHKCYCLWWLNSHTVQLSSSFQRSDFPWPDFPFFGVYILPLIELSGNGRC